MLKKVITNCLQKLDMFSEILKKNKSKVCMDLCVGPLQCSPRPKVDQVVQNKIAYESVWFVNMKVQITCSRGVARLKHMRNAAIKFVVPRVANPIQSNRSIFGQSTIQGRTIDYLVHNPIEIINQSCIIDFFGFFRIVFGLIIRVYVLFLFVFLIFLHGSYNSHLSICRFSILPQYISYLS